MLSTKFFLFLPQPTLKSWVRKVLALAVHFLTSLGILCSFFAMLCIFEDKIAYAFLWLGCALLIDAVDGTLARIIGVDQIVPNISGLMMDSIVDFINYIFIPALLLVKGEYLLPQLELILPGIILIISLFSYSRVSVYDDDFRYVGFPVAWNIVLVYLFILEPGQFLNSIIIITFIILKFIPLKYVQPFRTKKFRHLTLVATTFWFLSAISLCLNKVIPLNAYLIIFAMSSLALSSIYFICLTIASVFENFTLKLYPLTNLKKF